MLKRARLGGGGHWEWGTAPVCPACGQAYGGVEIEIEEGRIAGARTLPLAEIDRAEGAWTYDKRAGWVQRRDWEMGRGLPVKDGDPIEMVTEVDESEVDRKTGMVEARMLDVTFLLVLVFRNHLVHRTLQSPFDYFLIDIVP